jgi:hypothetical protein
MIQLSYQPAFDPFNAVYRILRPLPTIRRHGPLHRDQVRILDYYLLFPNRLAAIRMLPQHRGSKRLALRYEATKPYGEQPDDRTLFERMEPMQAAALQTLAEHNIVDPAELEIGLIKVADAPLAPELDQRIAAANKKDAELIAFLGVLASEYPLAGPNGLKDRTALLEFRYDTV